MACVALSSSSLAASKAMRALLSSISALNKYKRVSASFVRNARKPTSKTATEDTTKKKAAAAVTREQQQ
jgi:hypothetical protein